jgi:hypothetical protein
MSEEKKDHHRVPTIRELYNLARDIHETPPVELSEEELKKSTALKPQHAIFANKEMIDKFDELPVDVKERYQSYGKEYYGRVIEDVSSSVDRTATEHLRAVRAGLSPKDLSPDELYIVRTVYGPEWFKLAELTSENDD